MAIQKTTTKAPAAAASTHPAPAPQPPAPHSEFLVGSGTLVGGAASDILVATKAGTTLLGNGGSDALSAFFVPVVQGSAGVVFQGGTGNDALVGSAAGDIYRFNRGDGSDTILDRMGDHGSAAVASFTAHAGDANLQDRIEFGAGIRAQDVTVTRIGTTVKFSITGSSDAVQVLDWYGNGIHNKIEQIAFQDGTAWSASDVDRMLGQASVGVTLTGAGTLQGTQFDDVLTATGNGTVMQGGGGNDVLNAAVDGGVFALTLDGGAGNDVINGSYAGDTYVYDLGDGNDVIHDDVRALGADVAAFFAAHPDTDTYQDKLVFGAGIAAGDIGAERVGDDLVLHVKGDQGSLTVDGWYDGTMFDKIESLVFADGTTMLASDVDRLAGEASIGRTASGAGTLAGSQYDDALTATGFATVLTGGVGDDHLSAVVDGGVFGLTLDGGRGNDVLAGSYAGDTYVYNLGDGHDLIHDDVRALGPDVAAFFAANPGTDSYQDRIAFGAGITASDLSGERVENDLVLHVRGDQGSITVDGWYDGTMFGKIESFTFADGTTMLASDVDHAIGQASVGKSESGIGILAGSQYDDDLTALGFGTRMEGGAGNDTLAAAVDGGIFAVEFVGGRGNDVLVGSYAGDSYFYDLGDGHDLIRDDVRALSPDVAAFFTAHPDADTYQDHLQFGAGVAADDVARLRVGNDLVLVTPQGDAAAADAGVTIEGWFDGTGLNKIELIGFADGTTWTASIAEQGLA